MGVVISERLAHRANALNLVRLVLALAVLVSHSFVLGSGAAAPALGGLSLGSLAVGGFFGISGFLVARSRLRSRLGPFLWRRCVRIYPAFWAVLVFVAVVCAPLAAVVQATPFDASSATHYVLASSTLEIHQRGIGDGPAGIPYPGAWNGSLWTLVHEFRA